MQSRLLLLVCAFITVGCGAFAGGNAAPNVTFTPAAPTLAGKTIPPVVAKPTPGLVVRGNVRMADGAGLANVRICRSFAAYGGVSVATTDANGAFQTDFVAIPGDEMVSVWAVLGGYSFEPQLQSWRHYHGYEDTTVDFVARPNSATSVSTLACSGS